MSRRRWLQEKVATALGVSEGERSTRVAFLLERSRHGNPGYWLQLLLAMSIAILGLALDSTAVVIGAMLISPLMSSIVELGMGLAVGSPLLVLRSFLQVLKSVLVVVAGAALVTRVLPFHEVTKEIAARTSPTALDLLIAVCCAIAAAYAQLRPASETTATAAGTAIGIALVPPLCVIGYGIGTGSASVATGAALLFTANFCAIVLFAVLCFLLVGFDCVDVAALEEAEFARAPTGVATRIGRSLGRLFASKYALLLRVVMPLALVAAVYVPLRQALDEVTWEVRVTSAVNRILRELPRETVHTALTVSHRAVRLRLVTIGTPTSADALRRSLTEKIARTAGVTPNVEVVAVADAAALRAKQEEDRQPAVSVGPPEPAVVHARRTVASALSTDWPAADVGALARWNLVLSPEGAGSLEVLHAGAPLGNAGSTLLSRSLEAKLGIPIVVHDVAVPTTPVTADPNEGASWLTKALPLLALAGDHEPIRACVETAEPSPTDGGTDADAVDVLAVLRSTAAAKNGRMDLRAGDRWQVQLSLQGCPEARDAAVEDGPPPDAESIDAAEDSRTD